MEIFDIVRVILFAVCAIICIIAVIYAISIEMKGISIVNKFIQEQYIDTGNMIVLDKKYTFEFKEKQYVELRIGIDVNRDEKLSLKINDLEIDRELISNIRGGKKSFLNSILRLDNRDMLYRVKSKISNNILFSDNYGMFCPIEEKDIIEEYYEKNANYIWKIFKYINDEEWKIKRLDIDEKYTQEIDLIIASGEKIDLECNDVTDECILCKVSNDNLLNFEMRLIKNNGYWYWDIHKLYEGNENLLDGCIYEINACELSDSLGNLIDDNLSNE